MKKYTILYAKGVSELIGISENIIALLSELKKKWKERLEIWSNCEKKISRWINVMCGFLQGDSY